MQKLIFILLFSIPLYSFSQTKKTQWNGIASYYHIKFNGRKTANGAHFSNEQLTAASNKIPLGSKVRVTNLRNQKSILVVVNDKMGKHNKRLIDLTSKAAKELEFFNNGLCKVHVELVSKSKEEDTP